jgi:outer membrane receptor protein involved in Fe transport
MTNKLKTALIAGVSLNVIGLCAGTAWAADAPVSTNANASTAVTEIIVTSQRRSESLQKVPATVQAFTGETLQKLNVNTLDDLIKYTPNVTFANNGPGQGEITIRGLSSGFRGDQSSATIGNFPNVAIYLDDESMQFPGRNVDVYMVDMQRVEVLEGPQGTLFGGGAEAGAVRYITNKPNFTTYGGNAEGAYGFTSGGDPNYKLDATVNLPIIQDKLAIRATVYDERQGGYITNVPTTFTHSNADPGNAFGISPTNGVCTVAAGGNGLPSSGGAGSCALGSAPGASNAGLAGKGENPTTYSGGRFSIGYKINNDWDVLISESFSHLDADGLSVEYPYSSELSPTGGLVALKPLQNTEFTPSYDHDNYENTAWTLNGKIGAIKMIYTGSYLDRHIDQQVDYTNYTRTGSGVYYTCISPANWNTNNNHFTGSTCYNPATSWRDQVKNTHLSNEIRFSSPDDWRLRFLAGAFNEVFRIEDNMNFNYRTIPSCGAAGSATLTNAQANPNNSADACIANVETYPGAPANAPGLRGDTTGFGEDTQRGYIQTALFASADFDIIPHVLTITAGTRYFDYNEYEKGSVYSTGTQCLNVVNGCAGYQILNAAGGPDKVTYTGFKSRFGLTWKPTNDYTFYYLFSQGFRPGGFNRNRKDVIYAAPDKGQPQYQEPNSYAPDSLTNNEIGFKGQFLDHRLQLNLSAYYMHWSNSQLLQYNPVEGINNTFATNGPAYDIKGVEAQWVYRVTHGLTIQGSADYNDDTQSNSPCLQANLATANGAAVGQCITQFFAKSATSTAQVQSFQNPFGVVGGTAPFAPLWQGNIRARYEFPIADYLAHVQVGGNYVGKMYNQPANFLSGNGVIIPTTTYLRYEQPAYGTIDASVGVNKDNWFAELYGTNLTDNHASTFTSSAQFIKSEVPLRPTVIMLKIGAHF